MTKFSTQCANCDDKKEVEPTATGSKAFPYDRERIQLADDFLKDNPKLKRYQALMHACVLCPNGLPHSLSTALLKVPRPWNTPFEEHLTTDEMADLRMVVNRLNKALRPDRTWFVDTSSIEGSLYFDAEATELNVAMSKDEDEGWGPLCAFLGVPIPGNEFSRVNSTEEFWQLVAANRPNHGST